MSSRGDFSADRLLRCMATSTSLLCEDMGDTTWEDVRRSTGKCWLSQVVSRLVCTDAELSKDAQELSAKRIDVTLDMSRMLVISRSIHVMCAQNGQSRGVTLLDVPTDLLKVSV
jgi:hypothetical protein